MLHKQFFLEVLKKNRPNSKRLKLNIHKFFPNEGETDKIIIAIQGLGGHGAYFESLEPLVEEGYTILAPDLRGHGKSEGRRGDIASFNLYLKDIKEILDSDLTKDKKEVWMLGESMGASLAALFLKKYPDYQSRFEGVILVAPIIKPLIKPSLKEISQFLIGTLLPGFPIISTRGREEIGCREHVFNDHMRADELFIEKISSRFSLLLSRLSLLQIHRVQNISIPLLVIGGEKDKVTDSTKMKLFINKQKHQDNHVQIIQSAYHCLFHDPKTELVYKTIKAWMFKIKQKTAEKYHPQAVIER